MKVIHVVGSLDKNMGGPSRSVPQTCIELAKLGVKIEIICRPSANPVYVPTIENLKITFLKIGQLWFHLKNLKKDEIDLIHLQHVWDPYIHLMARFAQKNNIPYIITPRGMLEPWIMDHNPWKKKLGMFLYQKYDLKKAKILHATCQLEHDNIRDLGFKNPIKIIPNGVDLSNVPEAKEHFGTKKIAFMSRIHLKKGIELLLEVWQKIDNREWVLEIAGDGDANYVKLINNVIVKNKINNVRLVGAKYEKEKWEFIKSSDVFVLPTYSENFGIVVAESLAVGVPVITTTGTPWEELNTENCGWCIDLSFDELKQTLELAMETLPEELKIKGENGKSLIYSNYDIKSVAKKLKSVYQEIRY